MLGQRFFINLYCGLIADKIKRGKIRQVLLGRDQTEFLKDTIQLLNAQNADMENRVNLLSQENARIASLNQETSDLQSKFDMAQAQIRYLKTFRPGPVNKNLFISTGLISSINAMAIIKQLGLKNNDLIIYTATLTDKFKDLSMRVILSGFFDNIIFMDQSDLNSFSQYDNFMDYDEIYLPDQPRWRKWYSKHPKFNFIEEGISSYSDLGDPNDDLSGLNKIWLSRYNGLDFQSPDLRKCVAPISLDDQRYVIKKIRAANKIDFKYLRRPNQVLMLYHYVIQLLFDNAGVIDFYVRHINQLLDSGYSVVFKSHPRVNDEIAAALENLYHDNPSVQFIPDDIKWPIELLIDDIKPCAAVSVLSGAGLSISHIFGIHAYNIQIPNRQFPLEFNYLNLSKKIIDQNMPSLDEFINTDKN